MNYADIRTLLAGYVVVNKQDYSRLFADYYVFGAEIIDRVYDDILQGKI